MLGTVLENLQTIGLVFLLFSLCVIADILVKTYNNVENKKQRFDLGRFLNGFLKMFTIGLSTALLSIVASIIPDVPILGNIFETQELKDIVSFLLIVALYAKAIVKYFTKATSSINKVINDEDVMDFEQTKIDGV